MNADPLTHEEVVVHLVGDRVEIDGASACVLNAFHHTVAGVTSAFYAVDYRDGVTSYEVVRGQYMTLLEHASPWCNDDELLCKALCKEEGFCCNDPNVGSNQLLSCAQACMIRARGTGEDECKDACSAQTASRGCSREVNGHSYSMCSRCDDLDDTCPHGVQEHEHACHAGCAVAKEREICDFQPKDTCGNPGELCFYDPSCSNDASAVYFGGLGCNAGGVARNCRFCGFTTDSGVSYPNCPVMENALCRPTAHYNRSDIYTDAERERTALICSSYWSIDTCGQFREDLPCTEDLECTPESCPSGAAVNGRCRNSGVANGIGSGKCRWVGPEPVHCERAECTEGVWQTEASNGYGTCGAQIEWVQDNVEGMGERTDACTLVAQQGESPECAPCGPPSPLSLPPPPPVSCWSEERAGSTPEHTIADKNSDSLEHCKHLCRADEKCKSVTFSAEAHSCRLIDRRALPVPMGDDAIVTNFNFELCFTAPVSGRAWGNRLGRKRGAATIEACQKLCRTHPSCKSFIYRATEMRQGAAGTCHLMSTFYEDRYRSDFRWPSEVPSVVSNFLFSDFCQHGIVSVGSFDSVAATSSGRNFQVCCDAACGTCGGQGCSQRTGGEAGCCTRAIASSDVECTEIDQTRCIIPNIDNGEEACEGHGYGKARCEEVGCCQYAECPIGDGSGECHSAVGQAQCTPVEFTSHVEDLGVDRCPTATCPAATFNNGEGTPTAPVCESCFQLQPPCDDCDCPDFTLSFERNGYDVQAACTATCLTPANSGMWDQVGTGWTLVRRVKAGDTWHPSTDRLSGTDTYGTKPAIFASTSDETFSVAFGEFDQFLFATGDESKWLVSTKHAVLGNPTPCLIQDAAAVGTGYGAGFFGSVAEPAALTYTAATGPTECHTGYANAPRQILFSSLGSNATTAKWYNRDGYTYEPWVSLTDHEVAISAGNILYGESSCAGFAGPTCEVNSTGQVHCAGPMTALTAHASAVLPVHNGANVYVRNTVGMCTDTDNGATGTTYGCQSMPPWSGDSTGVCANEAYMNDDDDFTAMLMCCACGGGSTAVPYVPPAPISPICGQEVLLDFEGACTRTLQNNMGGQGPDTGAEELRFGNAGVFNGRPFDAVIETVGSYVKGNGDNGCGASGKFGKLVMRRSQEASFTMTFRDSVSGEPVTLPAFRLSFMDIDAGSNNAWKEQLSVRGFHEYTLEEHTYLTTTAGQGSASSDLWFSSTPAYSPASTSADNPTDPQALTETQRRLSVSFVFLSRSQVSFSLRSGRTMDEKNDRWQGSFFFTGSTNLVTPCPPSPPQSPTPPPPVMVQRRLQLEPTDLGCDADAVTLNFGAKNEPLTYWPSGDCDCDPETPCRQDVSGTCNPTTWCDACCETGSCAPGVSCDGYEEGGGALTQESCCAVGSTMCTRPEYFLADGGESCSTACAARGSSWQSHSCNLQAITAAAASIDNCKDVIRSLGMGFGPSGVYSDDDSGCTYHPGQTGWAQVMHSGRDNRPATAAAPTCSEVNGDSSRRRVCACTDPTEKSNECDVVVDNLGGLGPDFDRPPERRYRGVGNVNGASIDLVLRNTTAFHIPNWEATRADRWSTVNPCHGKFGDIWVALGGSFTLSFSFEYTASGAPAELAEFYFSIFDIDQTRNPWKSWQRGGTERIEVSGFSDYALSDPASQSDVDVEDGSQDACACVDPLPCAHDAIGNDQCLPTTWCAACCATGTCQPGVSCFGYEAGGAYWQGTCCAHGSTHCGESGNGESNVGIFKSQNARGVTNPSDPEQLSIEQKKVSVTTKFESKSSFEVLFKVNNPWRWGADDIFVGDAGRHFLFAGKSDLGT